jgi:mannose-6-phosphate isomerase-like protein (cupin superfamily)
MIRRRQFLQLPLVASASAAAGCVGRSVNHAPLMASDDHGSFVQSAVRSARTPRMVKAGVDRDEAPIQSVEATFHVKVSGKDTEGRCVVFDTLRPNKVGPRLHLHIDCDEWFFVREGEFKFQVGTDILRLTSGDSLLVPRNMQHAFVKTSEGVARLIVMHQPAGTMEEFFRSAPGRKDMTPEARTAVAEKHGMRFTGPALTPD